MTPNVDSTRHRLARRVSVTTPLKLLFRDAHNRGEQSAVHDMRYESPQSSACRKPKNIGMPASGTITTIAPSQSSTPQSAPRIK